MRKVLFIFFGFYFLFAEEMQLQQFLEVTNLKNFSANLLMNEKRNLEQFLNEVNNFTCLGSEGKQEALKAIKELEWQMNENATNIQQDAQRSMETYIQHVLSEQEMQSIIALMNDTSYGKRLSYALKHNQLDIINNSAILYDNTHGMKLRLTFEEEREIKRYNHKYSNALKALYRIASTESKKYILLDIKNNSYGKNLQKGVEQLQDIFMKEGCVVD